MGLSFSEEDERRRALMEAIFREHFSDVHRYISSKVRQPDVADDLTSIVFIKAFRWLLEDRGMRQVRSWLYATARSTIADYWQEQQRRLCLPLEMIEDNTAVFFEEQDDEQAQGRVGRLLQLLPARERQVLFLRYLEGYTAAEVGRKLGLSAGHVRVLQLRALRHAALLDAACRSRLRSARKAAQILHRLLRRKSETKEQDQRALYQKLIETSEQMVRQTERVVPLVKRVIAQTRSRVLEG